MEGLVWGVHCVLRLVWNRWLVLCGETASRYLVTKELQASFSSGILLLTVLGAGVLNKRGSPDPLCVRLL